MKVLHVTTPAHFGGLESVVEMLSRGLIDRGHEISVLAVIGDRSDEHPFVARLSGQGIQVVPVIVNARDYMGERRAVRAALVRSGAQVMHTHGYRADVLNVGVARSAGVPVVTTVHGFTGGGLKNAVYEWLQIRSYLRFTRVAAVSQPIVDRLLAAGVPAALICLIRNGYRANANVFSREEARHRLALDDRFFHVGWIGRLSAEKGPDVMYEAAQQLAVHNVAVSFVGAGPMLDELRRNIQPGVRDMVRFHGSVPDAGRLLKAFDVLAISSRTEGTPIVLLEAVSAGVPVVSTAVGGIPDVVSNAEATLVPPDDASELARGILRLKEDNALALRLANAASVRISRELNFSDWIDAYEELYQASVPSRRGAQ